MVVAVPHQAGVCNGCEIRSCHLCKKKSSSTPHNSNGADKPHTKNVRFIEEINQDGNSTIKEYIIERLQPLTDKEIHEKWYSLEDYASFREENLKIATQNHPSPDDPYSFSNTMLRIYASCVLLQHTLTPVDTLLLNKWAVLGHGQRGLERQSIAVMNRHARKQKYKLVKHVLSMQKHLMENGSITSEKRARILRHVSKKLSKPARLFAKALAKADEESVRFDRQKFTLSYHVHKR